MSKAEERALEAYPKKIEWVGNQWDGAPFDVNSKSRVAYEQGYQQTEKDLELTWEDIYSILYAEREVLREFGYEEHSNEEGCKEVLKRFKERKENEVQDKVQRPYKEVQAFCRE